MEKGILDFKFLENCYLEILDLVLSSIYIYLRDIKKIDSSSINLDDFRKANIYLKEITFNLLPLIDDIIPCLDIIYQRKLDYANIVNDYILERKLR